MPIGKRDYYKVLSVHKTSSIEEIQKAYRAASKRYHPDLNPNLKLLSEEKMRELVEAYEVLSDPEKRKAYDNQPHFQLKKSRRPDSSFSEKAFTKNAKKKKPFFPEWMFKKKETQAAAARDVKQADVHFMLGLSMSQNEGFYDQAIEEFRESVKVDPEYAEALWNLAILCYRKGLYDEAVINFQKVLNLNKEDAGANKMIGLLRED